MKKLLFLIPLGLAGILASCQQELEPSANVNPPATNGMMRYANWGVGGEGNCWISNIKYAFPISNKNNSIPEYTSGQAVKMIVNIHPK